jgi:hypothetical protein
LSRFMAHGPAFFGKAGLELETWFDVLTLRIIDNEFIESNERGNISLGDFGGLKFCAMLLAEYDILGCKTKFIRVRYGDNVAEYRIPERHVSEENLAIWKDYGWYQPHSPPTQN